MRKLAGFLGCVAVLCCIAAPVMAAGPVQAVDDYVETSNKVTHIDVLANDTTTGASTLRITSAPSNGEALVIANGSPKIKYTAFATGSAVDTFSYELCDASGSCSTATVTIGFFPPVTTTTSAPLTTTTTSAPVTTTPTSVPATVIPSGPSTETTAAPSTPPAPEPAAGEDHEPDPASTTSALGSSGAGVSDVVADAVPKVHALAETTLGSHDMLTAGTAVGEPRGIRLGEDVAYLGRSGLDTLALVATPALMVSGVVGFLMIGLPQNALGSFLGFLAGFRRRKKE
jgi:hypothetical protein